MKRFHGKVISGWRAVLLLPIAFPIAILAALWPGKKTQDRSADEVAGYIRDFIEGTGGDWDWDDFESVHITDPELDRIRQEAAWAGPKGSRNDANFEVLRGLLSEAEAARDALQTPAAHPFTSS